MLAVFVSGWTVTLHRGDSGVTAHRAAQGGCDLQLGTVLELSAVPPAPEEVMGGGTREHVRREMEHPRAPHFPPPLPSPDTTLAAVSSSGVRLAAQGIEDAQEMGVRGGDRHTGVRTVPAATAGTALGCPGLVF